jgi:hypothetical protein
MRNGKVRWGKGVYGMMRYMKMVAAGHYQLKWQGDVVEVKKHQDIGYHQWYVFVNGKFTVGYKKLDACMDWVSNVWGNEPVMTSNILNPAAGEFPIARKAKGGCCDPGTETYHCM